MPTADTSRLPGTVLYCTMYDAGDAASTSILYGTRSVLLVSQVGFRRLKVYFYHFQLTMLRKCGEEFSAASTRLIASHTKLYSVHLLHCEVYTSHERQSTISNEQTCHFQLESVPESSLACKSSKSVSDYRFHYSIPIPYTCYAICVLSISPLF